MICIFCAPERGRLAITKTRTPIPPIQCVKDLQISMDLGISSTEGIILEPVVVKPDTVSKNASMKLGIDLEKKKGRQPKNESTIHDRDTMTNPSFAKTSVVFGCFAMNGRDIAKQIAAVSNVANSASHSP